MIYFCADDYGISGEYNKCIESCLRNGALNKVSILPNGEISDFPEVFADTNAKLALHLNLVEGYPLSPPSEISLLVDGNGCFKYSFVGLLRLSLSPKRKEMEAQICTEIRNQIRFWKHKIGSDHGFLIDSHQHAYMIPLIFKCLLKVIKEEEITVKYLRIPAEPIGPYLLTPSLYTSFRPVGIIKQTLLNTLALINRPTLKKAQLPSSYFMGVMFSGRLNKERVTKLMKKYSVLAEKHGQIVEVGFHPGCAEGDQHLIKGHRNDFKKFYCSDWRKIEYETLMDNELYKFTKEGI